MTEMFIIAGIIVLPTFIAIAIGSIRCKWDIRYHWNKEGD